jgi:hypothetical protein
LRRFANPDSAAALWNGLALAVLFAVLSTWAGVKLGRWMRGIQR